MVMAQNPESTEYDGMPRSALGTGLVDYELPPAEMPAQLIAYVTHAFGKPPLPATPPPKTESALKREAEEAARMVTVVRDSNDAITIQDFQGGITAWNRGAALMYGYSEEEADRKSVTLGRSRDL